MYKLFRDIAFLLMVVLLTATAKDNQRALDCDCVAQSYHTMEGAFTTDHEICVRTKSNQELIGEEADSLNN